MIYLASPHSSPAEPVQEFRRGQVLKVAGYFLSEGKNIFSPIIYGCACDLDGMDWLPFDLDMLKHCDELWILTLPGWRESKGVQKEIEFWQQSGKRPIEKDIDGNPFAFFTEKTIRYVNPATYAISEKEPE